jgi:SAM-dependent methyltransferase
MLKYATEVAPEAEFFLARAEALPFAPGTFELITAAGALNYANVELSLSEIARVLSANGVFVPYDFSAGRRIRDDARLGQWHREFLIRFPSQPGYSLDLPSLCYESHGLTLLGYEKLEVEIPMSLPAYVGYILGEAGVELALSEGQAEADIRRYCEECLKPIFAHGPREVLFDAQVAYVRVR